jgi:two-component system, chemotaxis family, protein-glutamate methylesterase/glutaminase
MNRVIRVVVVDDSAYVRKVMKEMLSRSPFIEVVGAAHDGEDALEMVDRLKPDVVTCDLIMPGLDGVDFIERQMALRPVPIIIVSIAAESSERLLRGLDAGAVDFVQKPTALATDRMLEIADDLIAKIKAASTAPVDRLRTTVAASVAIPTSAATFANRYDMVVIGVSTGGPQGLKAVIPRLPADFPVPVAIVLHMPVGYTAAYAQRLNDSSGLTVVEAREGDEVRPGVVLLAPGGRHLTFRRDGAGVVRAWLDVCPLDTPHKPSVDVLFQSAAQMYGERVLGVVMTGMGDDGRAGSAWIKAKNGSVLTESEETCIVYGMPRSVVEAGLSDASVPLDRLAAAIVERI